MHASSSRIWQIYQQLNKKWEDTSFRLVWFLLLGSSSSRSPTIVPNLQNFMASSLVHNQQLFFGRIKWPIRNKGSFVRSFLVSVCRIQITKPECMAVSVGTLYLIIRFSSHPFRRFEREFSMRTDKAVPLRELQQPQHAVKST